jgi:hypothetical protein
MYTYAVQFLHQKTFRELKAIACDCAIVPARDRRCRQSWIDALVNVNPPLLELLEVSSVAELEQVQEAIAQTTETSPGVEVDPVSEPIAQATETSPGVEVDPVQESIDYSPGVETDRIEESIEEWLDIEELFERESCDCPACGGVDSLYAVWSQEYVSSYWNIYCELCNSMTGTPKSIARLRIS